MAAAAVPSSVATGSCFPAPRNPHASLPPKRVSYCTLLRSLRFPAFNLPNRPHLNIATSLSWPAFCTALSSDETVGFPKPDVIEWQKDLVNNVSLIGTLGNNVVIKYLDTGKVMAHCVLKVKRSGFSGSKDDSMFFVQFWDELAEIAAAHLKKEDRICVIGSIWVENYLDSNDEQKTICKVVARDLKFVGIDYRNEKGDQKLSINEQWEDYFDNPNNYWDNRIGKRNPKAPDFKHKVNGVALWIDSKYTPSWVKERLENVEMLSDSSEGRKMNSSWLKDGLQRDEQFGYEMKQGSVSDMLFDKKYSGAEETEKLWQAFFANPSDWWDNRHSKKNPKGPDFKHKQTGEALWIESYSSPIWVRSQLDALDKKSTSVDVSKDRNYKTSFDEEDISFF